MVEPTTITCEECGDGADPSLFPLTAVYQRSSRIYSNCIEATHQFQNRNNEWKPCVIYAINPKKPGKLDVRDLETAQIITVTQARIREYESDTQEQDQPGQKEMPEPYTDGSAEPEKHQDNQREILPDNSHNKNKKRTEDININEESDDKEALEPEAQTQEQAGASKSLNKTIETLLQRNIQIYQKLKDSNVTSDPEVFKLIYESTVISANNEIQKEETQNITNHNIPNDGDSYTKRLYQETTIRPFTEKYPMSEQEYYKYSAIISTYTNEHNEIPEPRLLEEVIKKCTDSERRRWNRWKENRSIEILQNSNDNRTKHQVLQSLNAFKYYEAFVIRDLNITPNREKLVSLLTYIRAGYDERPTGTYHRICTCIDQINSVIHKVNENKVTRYPMEKISTERIITLYKRVFLIQNAEEQYGNEGRLNKKVRSYLQRYVNQRGFELNAFIARLKAAEENALPSGTEKLGKVGQYWKTFKRNISIFEYKPYDWIKQRKRPLSPIQSPTPPRKRQKVSWQNDKCTFGTNCKYYISGKCIKHHTKEEVNKLNKKRIRYLEENMNKSQTGGRVPKPHQNKYTRNKPDNRKIPNRGVKNKPNNYTDKPPCKFGENCRNWQQGNCKFKHNKTQVRCSFCKKHGHLKHQCYTLKNKNTNKPTFQQYNPQQTPNPNTPVPYNNGNNSLFTQMMTPIQYPFGINTVIPNQFNNIPQTNNGITNNQLPTPDILLTNRIQELETALKDSKQITSGIRKQIKELEQQQKENINLYSQHARRS